MIKKKNTFIKEHINQSIIRQWEYKPHKNQTKNEKKNQRERERESEITFMCGKNMQKMGENDKFIVRG